MKKTLIKLAVVVVILLLAFSSYLLANNNVAKIRFYRNCS